MVKRVPCRECGNVVAETSKKCPYCGADPTKWLRKYQFLVSVIIVAFAADIYLNGGKATVLFSNLVRYLVDQLK